MFATTSSSEEFAPLHCGRGMAAMVSTTEDNNIESFSAKGPQSQIVEEDALGDRSISVDCAGIFLMRVSTEQAGMSVWTEAQEGCEWRDSDVGESCSDPDWTSGERCTGGGEKCGCTDSSSEEDIFSVTSDGDGASDHVFEEEEEEEDHVTPVGSHDSFGCDSSEWTIDWDDDESVTEEIVDDDLDDILKQFQPKCIPFSENFCRQKRTRVSPAVDAAQAVRSLSCYHRNCVSREESQPASSEGKKCVRFRTGSSLVQVRWICAWNYASRAVRRGPWEAMARDRERFRERIRRFEEVHRNFFSVEYRQRWRLSHVT